ncbi:MAG: cytochrome c [Elusimicrobia bacterium]|nr:cytochrome c [Elusimicrobiota bacterium]MDE2236384.1 cytochrome c [Elusimicrobiota bacterium]MDE2425999.1 cytochrome c [Elusimicrobiota bacterium]
MKSIVILLLAVCAAAAPASKTEGRNLFLAKCSACHAKDGKGNPGIARLFKAKLEDLNLGSARIQGLSDEKLASAVSEGVSNEAGRKTMPAFKGKLKDAEIADVVAYLRAFGAKTESRKAVKKDVE